MTTAGVGTKAGEGVAERAGGWHVLFDAHPRPMWVCHARSLRILAVNEEAVRKYGYPRRRFLSMSMLELVPAAEAGAVGAHITGAASAATVGTWRHVRSNGAVIDVEMTTSPVSFDGTDARLVLAHDVTERHRLHAALQASEQRFTGVFADAPVAQATLSLDGRLLQVNPTLCRMTGHDEADLVGEPLAVILPAEAGGDDAFPTLLTGPAPSFQAETRLRRRDGGRLDVVVSASRVADHTGRATCTVVLLLDVTERKAAERRLAHQALHDPLTQLPNRGLFVDRLEQGLRRLERGDHFLAVLFVDLDRFKAVNDRWGHGGGDAVLCEVATRLCGALRPHDTVARLGGDEFTVLCDDLADGAEVHEIATRLLAILSAPARLGGRHATLSASVGVALTNDPCTAAEHLLRDADAAMYEAKGRGRNRYEVFDQAMRARASARLERADAVRRALDQGEFRVFFQPEVELGDESTTGFEALVRWDHPRLGLVGPDAFIPLAEETGVILPLGEWVLGEACRQVAAWPVPAGAPPRRLSVNLSARQLARPELVDTVVRVLAETGLDPGRLCLEITESVLMDDVEASVEALLGLKLLGVRLAIDDFGTGYSSLGYLRRFAVDVVKVDRSFVAGMGHDPTADAIVAAVVNLSHALGREVVAEGVETRDQLVALRALGCDRGQGYRWSPPLPAGELLRRETARAGPVAPTSLDVRTLLARRAEAPRRATTRPVVLEVPAGLPSAFADAGALEVVLDHLVSNAVAYSGPERPVVVSATSDRRWLCISVGDLGIAMTAEQAARCFEQFWQAAVPVERPTGATGIGLYVVRSLVEAMGGRVTVRTAPGKGSTSTFSLPRSARAVPRARSSDGAGLDLGKQSAIHEFMRQIGVPIGRQ